MVQKSVSIIISMLMYQLAIACYIKTIIILTLLNYSAGEIGPNPPTFPS